MAEKRTKIGAGFDDVPAVKKGRGWLGLERGKTAAVYFVSKRGMLRLDVKTGTGKLQKFYAVADYAKANFEARKANALGEQAGAGFGALDKDEIAAIKRWREYVERAQLAGSVVRPLDEILRDAIKQEEGAIQTPSFADVAFEFLNYKEKRGCWSENVRSRHFKQVSLLSKSQAFTDNEGASKPLAKITVSDAEAAIEECVSTRRKTEAILDSTRAHWQKTIKEIFAWWYDRANADRPQGLLLKNPLRAYEIANVKNMEEPEIMTVADSRALLVDLFEHAPAAVPAVALQMFCGVRNAEVARVRWRDIRRDDEKPFLYLAKSITKTTVARSVPLSENLVAWLDACREAGVSAKPDSFLIPIKERRREPANIAERRRLASVQHEIEDAVERTGIRKPKNAFRHTAISAMCRVYNEFEAAQFAGHDRKIQGEFYKAAMSETDAHDYFGIMPPNAGNVSLVFTRETSAAKRQTV